MCNRTKYIQYFEVATLMIARVLSFFSHHRTDPLHTVVYALKCCSHIKKSIKSRGFINLLCTSAIHSMSNSTF